MLRSPFAALLLIGIGVSPAPLAADDAGPQKVALLVGVEQYLKPGFDDLDYCEDDVRAVGEELQKLGFSVTVLLGSGKDAAAATKENIEATTRRLVRPLGKRDVMLIMLSGHGQTLNPDPNADPNALDLDRFQSYYCPVDALLNDPASQVALNFLLDDILAQNVGRKLLVLDACRDIPEHRGQGGRNARGIDASRIDLRAGTSVYLSCSFGQRSFEKSDVGHGLFTYCLLDGLRGGAVKDGELAWADLVAHVNRRMRSPEMLKLMPPNEPQVPFPAGDLTDTLLGRLEIPRPKPELAAAVTNTLGMRFTLIPAGEFQMGSSDTRESLQAAGFVLSDTFDPSDEHPVHRVRITKPFYLGTYEVTKGQFAEFVNDAGHKTDAETDGKGGWGYNATTTFPEQDPKYSWKYWGTDQSDGSPVVNVTWHDATAFCEWLSRKERKTYRLPTEAEWEYACRAGTTTKFFTGDSPASLDGYGNMWDAAANTKFPKSDFAKYPLFPFDDGWPLTAPVGRFRPNAFGLHDMHGNVWEWCADWYDAGYYAKSPAADPPGPSSGSDRVYRGGGWGNSARNCRSADRNWDVPSFRGHYLGFRVALSPSGN